MPPGGLEGCSIFCWLNQFIAIATSHVVLQLTWPIGLSHNLVMHFVQFTCQIVWGKNYWKKDTKYVFFIRQTTYIIFVNLTLLHIFVVNSITNSWNVLLQTFHMLSASIISGNHSSNAECAEHSCHKGVVDSHKKNLSSIPPTSSSDEESYRRRSLS